MLENVNFDEAKQSQLTAVELLINMGYIYISREEALEQRKSDTSNFLLQDIAAQKLMEINNYEVDGKEYEFSEKDVQDAIDELENIPYEGLIDTAQKIYNIIMPTSGGKTIKISHGGRPMSKNFRFIDFKHPENNAFHVSVEYVASGKQNIRVDIIVFINGIPFAVIENKKSSKELEKGIDQINKYQGPEFCPKLFTYTQLLAVTNSKEFEYGTTGTGKKFYTHWKEKSLENDTKEEMISKQNQKASELIAIQIPLEVYEQLLNDLNGSTARHNQKLERLPTEQDRSIVTLFSPKRLLDLTKNHILFDAGIKKISRYQQYFAIRKMLERITTERQTPHGTAREGGLVWHTQGSGKSLTMVTFVKALIEDPHIQNPRVIIVTDRKDLDKQIKDTFVNCNLKKDVIKATSGKHLFDLIKDKNLSVITTLIHKFEPARNKNKEFTDTDKNIFVLVDEAHRSQTGIANFEMNKIIPNACYIGFTGTPLMKNEKESWRKFGGYIDKYTIDDALEDKIILPLIYEGRYTPLEQNEKQINRRFERLTAEVKDKQKKELQAYATTKIIKNNPNVIEEIAIDVEKHFTDYFKNTGLKAQLVAPSKYSAVLFQNFFEKNGKIQTAVVISDEHEDGNEEDLHKKEVVSYLNSVRNNHISVEKYEKSVIDSFKHNPDGVEIIIVVDKLLTGFDAPRNTVLYLAKDLHDHGLLQAIARVNRLFENKKLPKTTGFIIDYSENAKNIKTAMKLFGNYDDDDVKGTLIDVSDKIQELEQSFGEIQDIFKTINSSDDEEFLQFLADDPTRDIFYKKLNEFIRKLNECYVLQDFVHEFKHLDMYKRELKKLMELRKTASLKYADRVNLADYKYSLINILDQYVDAQSVELLTKQINITDRKQFDEAIDELNSDKSKAEAIAAQMDRTIAENMENDPVFYARFSEKISEIIEQMKAKKMADIEALKQLKLARDSMLSKKDDGLPSEIEIYKGSDIFYRNLRDNVSQYDISEDSYIQIVLEIAKIIKQEAIVDWYKNLDVKRKIMNKIDDYLYDEVNNKMNISISYKDMKKIIEDSLLLAEHNHELFS